MSRSAIFELLLWKDCGKDFQGFGLITEKETGGICMTGLWSSSEGVPFADYVWLYKLNTEARKGAVENFISLGLV